MNFALKTLRYSLECNQEDFSRANEKLKLSLTDDENIFYNNEIKEFEKNIYELKQAIKILNNVPISVAADSNE